MTKRAQLRAVAALLLAVVCNALLAPTQITAAPAETGLGLSINSNRSHPGASPRLTQAPDPDQLGTLVTDQAPGG
ncbi:MAG: hypothetical protein LC749_14560, partial [Actinobacteria bacterium]|nr:hypothetical protein [Actinomycetota bacterium]